MTTHTTAHHAGHAHHPGRAHHPADAPKATEHQQTYRPTNKTLGATAGSAVSTVVVGLVNHFWPNTISPEVATALTVVATFALGYLVPPGEREIVIATTRGNRSARA